HFIRRKIVLRGSCSLYLVFATIRFTAMRSIFVSILILAVMSGVCRSESYSMACAMGPDGKMNCVRNSDPNGNYAGAGSYSGSSGTGAVAGAGTPGNVRYNYGAQKLKECLTWPDATPAPTEHLKYQK
ncbi:hypothetical protein NPIL_142151, partial [Nephila pilipes]